MVAMTFNTDMGDSWEREGEDLEFFRLFSPPGYALGADVLLYAMTHCRQPLASDERGGPTGEPPRVRPWPSDP